MRSSLGYVAALAAALFVSPSFADDTTTAPPPPTHALTADDVGAYFDGFIPYAMARANVAGTVIVVVKDGQVLFERGYGVSDEDTQTPVDPQTTMFRPGSVSKLFTWTAVMQLKEEGKLDLDKDVNTYLDFTIPHTWGKPVTLRDLMTHTPGFEETIKNLLMTDPKKLKPLGDALKAWVPEEIFPPGTTPAYSNYGAAVAGYIVERVSGERFEDYVQHHIFTPLGMAHSTFDQPLPASLKPFMSKGYVMATDKPKPFELIDVAPAGALSASGGDMARFMIAHLNNGSYNGAQILKPETAKEMHTFLYQRNPPLLGMALGFYRDDRNGHVVIAHGGDTILFHSDLHLIPDANVGMFFSQNSQGKPELSIRGLLFEGFMNRYFPAPPPPKEPTLKTAKADGELASGTYEVSRRSVSNFISIGNPLGQSKLSVNSDGTITVDTMKNSAGVPVKWREVRPFMWRQLHGRLLLMAKTEGGKVTELVTSTEPQIITFMRPSFWDDASWNMPLFIGTLAMLLLTVLFWPIKAVLRWRYEQPFLYEGRAATLYRMTRVVALLDFVFLIGFLLFLQFGSEHLELLGSAGDIWLRLLQLAGLLGVVGVIFPFAEVGAAFGDRGRPWWTKGTDVLVAVACVATIWFAFHNHLLSLTLNY